MAVRVGESWLVTNLGVSADVVRPVAYLLVTVVWWPWWVPGWRSSAWWCRPAWWPALVVTGAGASLLLLMMCFHPWLVIGVAIDVVLLYLVLVNGWDPFAAGAAHRSMA